MISIILLLRLARLFELRPQAGVSVRFSTVLMVCIGAGLLTPLVQAQVLPGEVVPAIWQTHAAEFRFRSDSQHFRCEEVSARLQRILVKLGARLDARSQLTCMEGFSARVDGQLVIQSAVEATEKSLQEAHASITSEQRLVARVNGAADPATNIRAFPARWESLTSITARFDHGDCELLRAIDAQLRSALTLREFKISSNCSFGRRPAFTAVALLRVDPRELSPESGVPPAVVSAPKCEGPCEERDEALDPEVLPAG